MRRIQLTLSHHCTVCNTQWMYMQHTVSAEKRVFPLQVTLQPKCGRSEIGKRIWQRGLLPKETTLRAPGAQIRQRPGNAISSVPTENRLGPHGHSPKSWLIASTMRKRHLRVAPKSDLEWWDTDSELDCGLPFACDMKQSLDFTSCLAQRAREISFFQCTSTKKLRLSKFGSISDVAALRWRWTTVPSTTKMLSSMLTLSTTTLTSVLAALSPRDFPSLSNSTHLWWSKSTHLCSPFEGSSKAGQQRWRSCKFGSIFWSDVGISDDHRDVLDRSFCARVECSKDGTMILCLKRWFDQDGGWGLRVGGWGLGFAFSIQ